MSDVKKKQKEITWKGMLVGFSAGAVVASLFAVIMIVSLKQDYINFKKDNVGLKAELDKYRPLASGDMVPLTRYNEFVEKLEKANSNAERQDIITYYHPWPSDPDKYKNNWRNSYRELRHVLWKEIESYEDEYPGEFLKHLLRLGLWSKMLGEELDASDCFNIVIEFIDEHPFKVDKYVEAGIYDPAYRELGFAERYKIPEYIDKLEHKDIYVILYQYDGEWVKPEKLTELKKLEAQVKAPEADTSN